MLVICRTRYDPYVCNHHLPDIGDLIEQYPDPPYLYQSVLMSFDKLFRIQQRDTGTAGCHFVWNLNVERTLRAAYDPCKK